VAGGAVGRVGLAGPLLAAADGAGGGVAVAARALHERSVAHGPARHPVAGVSGLDAALGSPRRAAAVEPHVALAPGQRAPARGVPGGEEVLAGAGRGRVAPGARKAAAAGVVRVAGRVQRAAVLTHGRGVDADLAVTAGRGGA